MWYVHSSSVLKNSKRVKRPLLSPTTETHVRCTWLRLGAVNSCVGEPNRERVAVLQVSVQDCRVFEFQGVKVPDSLNVN